MILSEKQYPLSSEYHIQTITGKDKKGIYYYIAIYGSKNDSLIEKHTCRNSAQANQMFHECRKKFLERKFPITQSKTIENASHRDYNLLKRESDSPSEERSAVDAANEIRTNAEEIPTGTSTGALYGTAAAKNAGQTYPGDTGQSNAADRGIGHAASKSKGSNGRTESKQSAAMDTDDEQLSAHSGRNCISGIDLHQHLNTLNKEGVNAAQEALPPFLCEKQPPIPDELQPKSTEEKSEQLTLFDFNEIRQIGGSGNNPDTVVCSLSEHHAEHKRTLMPISAEWLEAILRTGGGRNDSRHRIYAKYQQAKSPEEMVGFLREEYGETGKGFIFGQGLEISVWFDASGMSLACGTSARISAAAVLPWNEIEEIIRKMVQNGLYMNADEIAKVNEIERKRIAGSIIYFFMELEDGYIDLLPYLKPNAPAQNITMLYRELENGEGIDQVFNVVYDTVKQIRRGEKHLLSNHYSDRMDVILDDLIDLRKAWITFPVRNDIELKQISFITQDEIDAVLMDHRFCQDKTSQIYQHFRGKYSAEENIAFLKRLYGTAGSSNALPNCDASDENHDSRGMVLSKGNRSNPEIKVTLSWAAIEKRIRTLVETGKYKSYHQSTDITPAQAPIPSLPEDTSEITLSDNGSIIEGEKLIIPIDAQIDNKTLSTHDWQSIQNTVETAIQEAMFDIASEAELDYSKNNTDSSIRQNLVNFHFSESIKDTGTKVFRAKEKYRQNIDAIQTLKLIESENRFATAAEQETLSKYIGWGGLPDVFDQRKESWANEYQELKALLTEDEYASARSSVLTAYYTDPTIIQYIYEALSNFGFKKGNIIDPAMGIGNFFAMLPKSMRESKLYGVELDSITGRIAKQLYPLANISICGFEKSNYPNEFFDVAIGNVPFGDYKVFDKTYDRYNFVIHDYFFAKTIDKVRSGGIIVFITSKGTMDKKNSSFRKYIAARAELLGAVRLPSTAFKANANTEVTTDILFLKKRDRIVMDEPDWVQLHETLDDIEINKYFIESPEMILGTMKMVSGPFGMQAICEPDLTTPFANQLKNAIEQIKGKIEVAPIDESIADPSDEVIPADPDVKNFSYTTVGDASTKKVRIYYRENSIMSPVKVSKTTAERIKGMIKIRECTYELIDYQLYDYSAQEIEKKQAELNKLYDAYTADYGLITSAGNKRAFQQDSSYFMLSSLEVLDDEGNFLRKADMFSKRTINKPKKFTSAETSIDALKISLNEKAAIDLPYMAELTGKEEAAIVAELSSIIFLNPITDCWEPADEYLSGEVVNKLSIAKKYASSDPKFKPNVTALEQIQPQKLDASEIEIRLGATWVDPKYIEDFLRDVYKTSPLLLGKSIQVIFNKMTGEWGITGKNQDFGNPLPQKTYGTDRINGYQILENALNLRDTKIYDTVPQNDGTKKRVLNKVETLLASTKQEAIKEAYKDWIFTDQARRQALCEQYNAIFNTKRPREFDGSHLEFPGITPYINLLPHQKNGVARILYGGNTLLAHCVGAGKTYTMVAAAMELKRLGLCNKSMFVVPNHLIIQWASDFLRLYPGANILATTQKDFEKQNRKRFCSRIATGEYDAVIIGHSQFEKIPLSVERQQAMLNRQIEELEISIVMARSAETGYYTVKQMEKSKRKLEERLERLNENSDKDDVVTFEQLGIDQLFVDESHMFKNLFLYTKMGNVAGISRSEAKKSSDMYAKCQYMDEITGSRGITFATGTPINNSMTELYTNMRYLQYDMLMQLGLEQFDSWASNFGETQTVVELAPEGSGYQTKTRFSRFYNLPELINLFKECADIQTAEMLELPRPKAHYIDVLLKPSEIQKELVKKLAERAEAVRKGDVDSRIDNLLLITNDGRKLALDQRLINSIYPENADSKVNACVKNAFQIWKETEEIKGTQLIFCDMSTPRNDGYYNVYDAIRSKLIIAGVPKDEIAYIHDANTDVKKSKLFAKVRTGRVRFLLGSTPKMGAGTNVQNLLVALHHTDVPWRPSDIEQREGRILRRGNLNKEVRIFRYITENTFDSYSWQIIENKQRFISQIMTDKSPVRSAEDIDDATLNYAEVKALATGNPLIKEKMDLDIQVSRLKIMKANYASQKYRLEDDIAFNFPRKITNLKNRITGYKEDIQLYENNKPSDDTFHIEILGTSFNDTKEAGACIIEFCQNMLQQAMDSDSMTEYLNDEPIKIGSFMGFTLMVYKKGLYFYLYLKGSLFYSREISKIPSNNIKNLVETLSEIDYLLAKAEKDLHYYEDQLENAKIEVLRPFTKEDELKEKQERLIELNALLNITEADKTPVLID